MEKDLSILTEKLFRVMDPSDSYSFDDYIKDVEMVNSYNNYLPYSIDLNFANKSENEDPKYATKGSSGFDLRASENKTIQPGCYETVSTGLFFEIPENFEIQVRPRSGLAAKNGVTVLNTPGTIDSDYRGEIKVILINHGKEPFVIEPGDRIAQAVISPTSTSYIKLNKIDQISDDTERGSGGFGSTGIK